MAERIMLVCDVCGKTSVETVGITADGKSYRKDLCAEHLAELLRGTSAPRRGRPRKVGTEPAAEMRVTPTRRGRPPRVQPADRKTTAAPGTKRPRGKITDPKILAMRRAALAKARQARADKRAAAKAAG
jgi:hypothetical protein